MNSKRKVSQVFNNNPQGSPQRVRPKNRWWNGVQTDNDSCKIKKLEKEVKKKNRLEWEKCIKEGKVCIGL